MKILKILADEHYDTQKKLHYSDELIELATAMDSFKFIIPGLIQKGNALRLKGDLNQALESFFKAATLATERELFRYLGLTHVAIADVFSISGNHEKSIEYYHKAIDILREENDSVSVASAILNAGDEFYNNGELDSALVYLEESGQIFEALDYDIGVDTTRETWDSCMQKWVITGRLRKTFLKLWNPYRS